MPTRGGVHGDDYARAWSGKVPVSALKSFWVRWAAPAGRSEMVLKSDTPGWIAAILSWPWLLPAIRIALFSAFLI